MDYYGYYNGYAPTAAYGQPAPAPYYPQTYYPLPYYQSYAPGYYAPPPVAVPPQPSTPVSGGVSLVLDYDLEQMTRFVLWVAYGLMGKHNTPSSKFELQVRLVLGATRLPKTTIVLLLMYLNQRFPNAGKSALQPVLSDGVFVYLCVALVLGNKFNDDHTFTNKLWASATGLPVELLNKEERVWLAKVCWHLNNTSGFDTLDQCWSVWCRKYGPQRPVYGMMTPPRTPVGGAYDAPPMRLLPQPMYQPAGQPVSIWLPDYTPRGYAGAVGAVSY